MDQAAGLRGIVQGRKDEKEDSRSLSEAPFEMKSQNSIRVISVTSGKGGVGKTSVVANLALALHRLAKRVLILDADLGLANMDIMLGLNPRYTISHLLKGEKRLDQIIISAPGGIKLLPAASGVPEMTELDNSQRLLLLNELDTLQDLFDVLLIDTGAGISSNVMYFNFAAMEKMVVVTNEPTSLTDAYALIKVLNNRYQQKRFRILVNAVRTEKEAENIYRHLSMVVDKFLGSLSLDYLGWIPHDKLVPSSIRQQEMVLMKYPDAPSSKSFMALAERLVSDGDTASLEGDIRFFWQKFLNY